MNVYATVTIEGLNEEAVDDLMHSRSDGEFHREMWGDEMADHLMETGGTGPTPLCATSGKLSGPPVYTAAAAWSPIKSPARRRPAA